MKEIEDKILEVLSNSTGNILEDESAISVITEAKRLGNEIAAKQKQGEETEAAIDAARVAYAPCGEYLSTLFFCISGGLLAQTSLGTDSALVPLLLAAMLIRGGEKPAVDSDMPCATPFAVRQSVFLMCFVE